MRSASDIFKERFGHAGRTSAYIDGRWSTHGERYANISPIDGTPIAEITRGADAEIEIAVASASMAYSDQRWRGQSVNNRKRVLHALASAMEARSEELALLETIDTGKPISDTRAVDIPLAIKTCRYYAEAIDKIYGEVANRGRDVISYAVHEPLGVVGAIVPWNFPLHMAMWKMAPALAMGNSVVLKPAEQSPMTALLLAELANDAGLPPGVLNVVPGFGSEAGQALARHSKVDMIAFTGSGAVGRQLMRYSADSNLKRVSLELGGKSPQIIFDDCANLEAAVQAAVWGVFYNQGQVCTAASRLLVQSGIKKRFMERLFEVVSALTPGDPLAPETRLGSLIDDRQLDLSLAFVERARHEGAIQMLGGHRVREESGGFYMAPTVFDRVHPGMELAEKEVFGPVLAVIDFETEEEAYEIANSSDFGLAAGAWTGSLDRAMRAVNRLCAGLVWINGWDACDITMPFGGFKQSGFGRDRSLHAMLKYADLKSVTISFDAGRP